MVGGWSLRTSYCRIHHGNFSFSSLPVPPVISETWLLRCPDLKGQQWSWLGGGCGDKGWRGRVPAGAHVGAEPCGREGPTGSGVSDPVPWLASAGVVFLDCSAVGGITDAVSAGMAPPGDTALPASAVGPGSPDPGE